MCRLSDTTETSVEGILHCVLQFENGTRNLWRQEQCWIKGGVSNEEHLRKTLINVCFTPLIFFSDALDCPLLPLSNTLPVSINFLCHIRIPQVMVDPFHACFSSIPESAHPILSQQTKIHIAPLLDKKLFYRGLFTRISNNTIH